MIMPEDYTGEVLKKDELKDPAWWEKHGRA